MSEISEGDPASPKLKKKESTRGVIIVAVLCGVFLWWWFTMDLTPQDVGPEGLVERAFADLDEQKTKPPVLFEFDLMDLAMGFLRSGQLEQAANLAGKIQEPVLQAKTFQTIAQGYLGKDAGSMGPGLSMLEKIKDPVLRESAQEVILLEIARMGFPDVAWEQASSLLMKARLLRVMAETDAQELAKTKLKNLEPELASSADPHVLEEWTWTRLWLRQSDAVLAALPRLPEQARDEISAELYRMTRIESPERAAPLLLQLPERLKFAARLEEAKMNEDPAAKDALLSELQATANNNVAAQIALAKARWQLARPDENAWKSDAAKAGQMLEKMQPAERKISPLLDLARLSFDALDLEQGNALLDAARKLASGLPDAAQRLGGMAPVIEVTLESADPEKVRAHLQALGSDLAASGAIEASNVETLRTLGAALFREGDWWQVALILDRVNSETRTLLLQRLGSMVIAAASGESYPSCQDSSMQKYRQLAASQGETNAAKVATRLPATPERARAWVEIAKGLVWKNVIDGPASSPRPSE